MTASLTRVCSASVTGCTNNGSRRRAYDGRSPCYNAYSRLMALRSHRRAAFSMLVETTQPALNRSRTVVRRTCGPLVMHSSDRQPGGGAPQQHKSRKWWEAAVPQLLPPLLDHHTPRPPSLPRSYLELVCHRVKSKGHASPRLTRAQATQDLHSARPEIGRHGPYRQRTTERAEIGTTDSTDKTFPLAPTPG